MRYLMLIKHTEAHRALTPPAELYDAMGKFVTAQMASGAVTDTAGLKPTSDAWSVEMSGGKLAVVDGPFAESKECVGGYAIVDVKTREEASALAHEFMDIHRVHWPEFEGKCEVRPLENM